VITILICIAVPFTFTKTKDGDDTLWVPINANVLEYKSWVDTKYPSTVRFATMIFVGSNVLTPVVLSAVSFISTVKPVLRGHLWDNEKLSFKTSDLLKEVHFT
jgi:hypothetical protein